MRAAIRPFLLLLGLCAVVALRAQGDPEAHTRIADRYYARMAYASAIDEYKLAASMGAANEHVIKRLADCYMKLGDTGNGEVWYAQVVKFLNREPLDLYMYAQALKGNGKYAEAEEWMDRYLALAKPEGQPEKSNISDFAKKFTYDADRFTVHPLGINSPWTDMAATWDGPDHVIFASARDFTVGVQRRSAWNNEPFLDLYVADREPGGNLARPERLKGNVNSKLHEGPAVRAADGTLWFTRTNAERSKNGVHRLSILRAQQHGDEWKVVGPFLYNNPECSVGHPAISADGRTLYFVSDMPGGFGGTDLYVCKDMGGQWGEPENLGPAVNTAQNEVFPFVAADGTLYFSSNGQPGLGGLDVFAAPRGSDGTFSMAVNVGAPVNSTKDDFAFVIDAAGKAGYFSSDRPGGAGGDDIYSFEMHAPLEQRFLCTGVVIDDEDETPVAQAPVDLLDKDGTVVESTVSDNDGKYAFAVQKDREYGLRVQMTGRYDAEQHLSTENIEQQQIVARDLHLVPDAGIWLRGVVRYKDRIGFVSDVKVSVVNMSSFYSEVRNTGDGGDIFFRLQPNEQYEVLLEKAGFYSISVPVSTANLKQGVIDLGRSEDLRMDPVMIGEPVRLKFVKPENGSDKLDPIAKTELDGLADRLQVNPALTAEIAVHSDAQGDAATALKLTQKRAEVIVSYLQSKGITKDRLTAKGYGGKQPINQCGPGVTCTEAEYAENRRVEYTITGNGPQ